MLFSLKVLHIIRVLCNGTPVVNSVTRGCGEIFRTEIFLIFSKFRETVYPDLPRTIPFYACCPGVIISGTRCQSQNYPNLYDKLYEHPTKMKLFTLSCSLVLCPQISMNDATRASSSIWEASFCQHLPVSLISETYFRVNISLSLECCWLYFLLMKNENSKTNSIVLLVLLLLWIVYFGHQDAQRQSCDTITMVVLFLFIVSGQTRLLLSNWPFILKAIFFCFLLFLNSTFKKQIHIFLLFVFKFFFHGSILFTVNPLNHQEFI